MKVKASGLLTFNAYIMVGRSDLRIDDRRDVERWDG